MRGELIDDRFHVVNLEGRQIPAVWKSGSPRGDRFGRLRRFSHDALALICPFM